MSISEYIGDGFVLDGMYVPVYAGCAAAFLILASLAIAALQGVPLLGETPVSKPRSRAALVGAFGASAALCLVGMFLATVQTEQDIKTGQKAYEAILFDRYGLTSQNWNRSVVGNSEMPHWKTIEGAGSTGVVTTLSLADEPRSTTNRDLRNVKITLDGDLLKVTLPGGEEFRTAGGDTGE